MESQIENAMERFNFGTPSGILLLWKYTALRNGCWALTLQDQPFWSSKKGSTKDHKALERYRKRSHKYGSPIEPGSQVDQEWLAGLAAQTLVADQRTSLAPDQFFGQLVMPVFGKEGADQIFLGVIELVTADPKKSYVEDFNQIHDLLKTENLATNPLAKMIQAFYLGDTVEFPLPISSGIPYLRKRVIERFMGLTQKAFRIKYKDSKGIFVPISDENDLQHCIASSGSPTIRMLIE